MEKLRINSMGNAWFVINKYNELFGTSIGDFSKITTMKNRTNMYENCRNDHKEIMEYIVKYCSEAKLGGNKFGVSGKEVIEMAKKCLERM